MPKMGERRQASNAMRTWGIAGELLTARRPTERSVSRRGCQALARGWREQESGRICYKNSSCLCPLYMDYRLIYAIKQGQKAPQASKNQTDPCCHQKGTVQGLDLTGSVCSQPVIDLRLHTWVFRSCIRKTSARLHGNFLVTRCRARVVCKLKPPVASTFQRGCLQAFSRA